MTPQSRAFTIKANVLTNQIITEVSICEAFDPAVETTAPRPPFTPAKALWDTGATKSVISESLLQVLGLQSVGMVDVTHAGGVSQQSTHLVNIILPHSVGCNGILVTCSPLRGFDVIIGMDIITQGDFALTNVNGKTCFSFRTPSQQSVDYVEEHNKLLSRNMGANDPCFCGAMVANGNRRMKFKECHGKK